VPAATSNRHRCLDGRVTLVVEHLEVFKRVIKDRIGAALVF
jgi:hypothetical protein